MFKYIHPLAPLFLACVPLPRVSSCANVHVCNTRGWCLAGKKCFYSGEPATHMALFARAF